MSRVCRSLIRSTRCLVGSSNRSVATLTTFNASLTSRGHISAPSFTHSLATARHFQTESEYHTVADEMLETIQDVVEQTLEDEGTPEFEITYASGVLTMAFPPHGTWVINKQTPNQQLWWSSPISGPRRYEYYNEDWVFTRDESDSMTLTQALREEIKEIYQVDLDL